MKVDAVAWVLFWVWMGLDALDYAIETARRGAWIAWSRRGPR